MIPVQYIAATQMFFLIEGMNDAARREGKQPIHSQEFYKRIADEVHSGVVDYIAGLAPIIDTLTACMLVALENEAIDFPGVFEYEVTATVGDWFYTNNCKPEGLSEDYKAACSIARECAFEFFSQSDANNMSYPAFMNAAYIIEDALTDGTYQFKAGVSR